MPEIQPNHALRAHVWQEYMFARSGWAALLSILLVTLGLLLGGLPMVLALRSSRVVQQRGFDLSNFTFEGLGVAQPTYVALLLVPFVFGSVALIGAVRYLHRRAPSTLLLGRAGRWRWSRFWGSCGLWMLATLSWTGIDMVVHPDDYERVFDGAAFAKTLGVVLVLLPIQVMFEEALTRGFLLQQLASWTRKPWLSMLIVSAVFAGLHYGNVEVEQFGTWGMLSYYMAVGMLLGALTLLDDGLELACGIHLATNLSTALLINAADSSLPTPSLYVVLEPSLLRAWVGLLFGALVFIGLFWRSLGRVAQVLPQGGEDPMAADERLGT